MKTIMYGNTFVFISESEDEQVELRTFQQRFHNDIRYLGDSLKQFVTLVAARVSDHPGDSMVCEGTTTTIGTDADAKADLSD